MREERLPIILSPEELEAVDNLDSTIACRAGRQFFGIYFGRDLREWEQ